MKKQLPKIKYLLGRYVPFNKLNLFDKKHKFLVDSSILCAFVHETKWDESKLANKSKKFIRIYKDIEDKMFGHAVIYFGCKVKMSADDILTIGNKEWPSMAIELTNEDKEIIKARLDKEFYNKNLIQLGTIQRFLDFISKHRNIDLNGTIVFNKNNNKLTVDDITYSVKE